MSKLIDNECLSGNTAGSFPRFRRGKPSLWAIYLSFNLLILVVFSVPEEVGTFEHLSLIVSPSLSLSLSLCAVCLVLSLSQPLFPCCISAPEEGFDSADKNTNKKVDLLEVTDFYVSTRPFRFRPCGCRRSGPLSHTAVILNKYTTTLRDSKAFPGGSSFWFLPGIPPSWIRMTGILDPNSTKNSETLSNTNPGSTSSQNPGSMLYRPIRTHPKVLAAPPQKEGIRCIRTWPPPQKEGAAPSKKLSAIPDMHKAK